MYNLFCWTLLLYICTYGIHVYRLILHYYFKFILSKDHILVMKASFFTYIANENTRWARSASESRNVQGMKSLATFLMVWKTFLQINISSCLSIRSRMKYMQCKTTGFLRLEISWSTPINVKPMVALNSIMTYSNSSNIFHL